jgi:dTDP-4-amino-4,6-dideoxygalactose transaminase
MFSENTLISLADPVLCEEEKAALCSVIESGWLTMGERVAAFERAFAELHGAENAVAVNSCTAGLHLCLAALGIGPGDEVLAPALTFVATINAILYVGAAPVFVDIETEDLPHISLRDAEAKRTPKTRAAMIMHYGGYMADTVGWRSFCDAHRLKLIEDAAHAPAVKGVARLGDASAFSFFTNKNMTTAEGGMVLAGDPEVLEKTRRMRSHGMTTGTLDRHRGHAYSYDVTVIGYNYRMDELRAAMGLVQLARLPGWNARRRELSSLYRRRFSERLPQVSIPFSDEHESAAHLMPVLLPQRADREQIMVKLREAAIQSSIHYPPVHGFSYFRRRFPGVTLPNTDKFSSRELTLPLHPSLSDDDVDFVVQTLKKAIER